MGGWRDLTKAEIADLRKRAGLLRAPRGHASRRNRARAERVIETRPWQDEAGEDLAGADLGLGQDRPRRASAARLSGRRARDPVDGRHGARAAARPACPVREVSDFTGAPEILDGRVKTLHPRVHGGILGRPTRGAPRRDADRPGIVPIDLVVVNLYPFRETVARGAPFDEVIENIDIGGPAMIRSAAKNHERVAVVVDPADYAPVLAELDADGEVSARDALRAGAQGLRPHRRLRRRDRRRTSGGSSTPEAPLADFPEALLTWRHAGARAALRREPAPEGGVLRASTARAGPSLARAEVLQGKELSYNNLLDLDAALRLCAEFAEPGGGDHQAQQPLRRRRRRPRASPRPTGARARPTRSRPSAASSRSTARSTRELARELAETFLECVIAPAFAPEALRAARGQEEPAPARARRSRRDARRRASSCAASRAASWCRRATATPRPPPTRKVVTKRAPTRGRAARSRLRLARLQARQVERHRVRRRRAHAGHRRRPDVARRFGAHRRLEGARAARRARRSPPTPSSRSATASTRPPRRAPPPSSSRAARCATPSRSPPPTSTASRWCSPASATSGTRRMRRARLPGRLGRARARAGLEARGEPALRAAGRRARATPGSPASRRSPASRSPPTPSAS